MARLGRRQLLLQQPESRQLLQALLVLHTPGLRLVGCRSVLLEHGANLLPLLQVLLLSLQVQLGRLLFLKKQVL